MTNGTGRTVVVTGVGGPAGRAVARLLSGRGHRVIGADLRTVALDGIATTVVPAATHPEFVGALHLLATGMRADLIIPTVSEELTVLAVAPPGATPVVVGPATGVRVAADKWLTARALHQAGVTVPRSVLGGTPASWTDLVEQLGAPLVSKPRHGRGGRGVVVHHCPPTGLDDTRVLQEFASGTEYCPAVHRRADGRTCVVVLEKTELAQGRIGNGTAVRRVFDPDVAAVALAAVEALELTGPVDVDVRRRSDGVPVVLEVNARFGAHAASSPEILDAVLAEHLSTVTGAR